MKAVHIPDRIEKLWEILSDHRSTAIFAGGTDLFPRLRKGVRGPACLVGLERIRELGTIQDHGDEVFLGACTTHSRLLSSPLIQEYFQVLAKGLSVIGSPHIRNMGTLGGNIVTASPAGDALPPLYVLGAQIEIMGESSRRRVHIQDFIKAPGKVDLAPGEIVSGVWLRKGQPHRIHHFEKVGQRNALAIAIVSMAALIDVSEDGAVRRARFAWGSVGPTVVTSKEVDAFMIGKPLDVGTLTRAAGLTREAVLPIDDIRATASYRRTVAGNLLLRLIGR